jgi:hypothetical protein
MKISEFYIKYILLLKFTYCKLKYAYSQSKYPRHILDI